jgi:hypothetical protein
MASTCCEGTLKSLCSSREGVHLGPEKDTCRQTVYRYGSIDTSLDPPLFSLSSTVPLKQTCYINTNVEKV